MNSIIQPMKSLHPLFYVLIIVLYFLAPIQKVISQDKKLIYDYESDSFRVEGGLNDLKKDDKISVVIERLNPFLYDVTANTKLIDKNPIPSNLSSFILGDFSSIATKFDGIADGADPLFDPDSDGATNENEKPDCFDSGKVDEIQNKYIAFLNEVALYEKLAAQVKRPIFNNDSIRAKLNILSNEPLEDKYQLLRLNYIELLLSKEPEECNTSKKLETLKPEIEKILKTEFATVVGRLGDLKAYCEYVIQNDWVVESFKAQGDEAHIQLTITPRAEAKLFERPLKGRQAKEKFKVKEKNSIIFSSGLLLAWDLNDKNYNSVGRQVNDSTLVFGIIREDEPNVGYGINAMINFINNRTTNSFGYSVGLGYMPIQSKLSGLIGFTVLPGRKQKILLSGGIGVAFRKTLSDALSLDLEYPTAPEIKRKEELAFAPWISIAYKL